MPVDHSTLLAFALAAAVVYVTPGVDMAYIASKGVAHGRRAALWAAAGTVAGVTSQAIAAALGVTALFAASPVAFEIVRWLGVAYLCWLGVQTLRARDEPTARAESDAWRPWPTFARGAAINVLNPKIALFFLAFLPQFVDPERGSVALQLSLLGALFAVGALLWCAALALAFGSLGARAGRSAGFRRWQRRISGSAFIGFAGVLGVADLRR